MNDIPSHNQYSGLYLFNESSDTLPLNEHDIQQAIDAIEENETCHFALIEVVFVDREQILKINSEYLDHHYSTDIITFHYNNANDITNIEGTLYGCYEQIKEQAQERDKTQKNEFMRIVIHGLLHLCGYDDKTNADQDVMTQKENFYLNELSVS